MKEKLAEANKHYKELEALTNKDTIQVAYKDGGGGYNFISTTIQLFCVWK